MDLLGLKKLNLFFKSGGKSNSVTIPLYPNGWLADPKTGRPQNRGLLRQ